METRVLNARSVNKSISPPLASHSSDEIALLAFLDGDAAASAWYMGKTSESSVRYTIAGMDDGGFAVHLAHDKFIMHYRFNKETLKKDVIVSDAGVAFLASQDTFNSLSALVAHYRNTQSADLPCRLMQKGASTKRRSQKSKGSQRKLVEDNKTNSGSKFTNVKEFAVIARFGQAVIVNLATGDNVFELPSASPTEGTLEFKFLSEKYGWIKLQGNNSVVVQELWSVDDVCLWLNTIEATSCVELLRQNKMNGSMLCSISAADLIRLGNGDLFLCDDLSYVRSALKYGPECFTRDNHVKEKWYFVTLTPKEAKELVMNDPPGTFVVYGFKDGKRFGLTYKYTEGKVDHTVVEINANNRVHLRGSKLTFKTISDLVQTYKCESLNIRHVLTASPLLESCYKRVDEAAKSAVWYKCGMSKRSALQCLSQSSRGQFVIRDNENELGSLILSYSTGSESLVHTNIRNGLHRGLFLSGSDMYFESLSDLVNTFSVQSQPQQQQHRQQQQHVIPKMKRKRSDVQKKNREIQKQQIQEQIHIMREQQQQQRREKERSEEEVKIVLSSNAHLTAPWYLGNTSEILAISTIELEPSGSFVVCRDDTKEGCYTLYVIFKGDIFTRTIVSSSKGVRFTNSLNQCRTLSALIHSASIKKTRELPCLLRISYQKEETESLCSTYPDALSRVNPHARNSLYYIGNAPIEHAIDTLKGAEDGAFVVRYGKSNEQTLWLDYVANGQIVHCRILNSLHGLYVDEHHKRFESLSDLIAWYCSGGDKKILLKIQWSSADNTFGSIPVGPEDHLSAPWYRPDLHVRQLKSLLSHKPNGSFFIRNHKDVGCFRLVYVFKGDIMYNKIELTSRGMLRLRGGQSLFCSVAALVAHYCTFPSHLRCVLKRPQAHHPFRGQQPLYQAELDSKRANKWFQFGVNKVQALDLLKNQPNGAFVIRNSESRSDHYALSYVFNDQVKNEWIGVIPATSRSHGGVYLDRARDKVFNTLEELVDYYKTTSGPMLCVLRDIEENCEYSIPQKKRMSFRRLPSFKKKQPHSISSPLLFPTNENEKVSTLQSILSSSQSSATSSGSAPAVPPKAKKRSRSLRRMLSFSRKGLNKSNAKLEQQNQRKQHPTTPLPLPPPMPDRPSTNSICITPRDEVRKTLHKLSVANISLPKSFGKSSKMYDLEAELPKSLPTSPQTKLKNDEFFQEEENNTNKNNIKVTANKIKDKIRVKTTAANTTNENIPIAV